MAAQDFRHCSQLENEPVTDFIRRLERTFRLAYGHNKMLAETKDALLHGQLQEGLRQHLMEAPAVSSASTYSMLCHAAMNEERRQVRLSSKSVSSTRLITRLSLPGSPWVRPQPVILPMHHTGQKLGQPKKGSHCSNVGTVEELGMQQKIYRKRKRENTGQRDKTSHQQVQRWFRVLRLPRLLMIHCTTSTHLILTMLEFSRYVSVIRTVERIV